jgi:hypothetical protein
LRGLASTVLATLPFTYALFHRLSFPIETTLVIAVSLSAVGGFFYAAPSLLRIRSRMFVESYKG